MNLSMTTDYVTNLGDPLPYLRRIAAAGFTHVHWCHEWNTDYLYSEQEVDEIATQLDLLGLRLLDLHASHGNERCWGAIDEELRRAGVELIENRMRMTARLGSSVIVLHVPDKPGAPGRMPDFWDAVYRSLDELEPMAWQLGVRIAIENMPDDDFHDVRRLFARYEPRFLGLCYDSGHGNIGDDGLAKLELYKNRLVAIHLHDNDGRSDLHNLPFTGTVEWERLMSILSESSYAGCVSLESNMRGLQMDGDIYLAEARAVAQRLSRLMKPQLT